MSVLERLESSGCEELLVLQDPVSGLRGVLVIDDTSLGSAAGGTRFRATGSLEEAAHEALGAARAATRAHAASGVPRGGGHAVLIGGPDGKSRAVLQAYARVLDRLDGRFVAGPDAGFDSRDLAVLSRMTHHVVYRKGAGALDATDLTAVGVLESIRAAAETLGRPLDSLHVVIQGVGGVGLRLARLLAAEQARLTVADVDSGRAERAQELGAEVVSPEALYDVQADVFSPNAVGALLTEEAVARLRVRLVAGAASGVLADQGLADRLHERGILYAPDFIVGSGGLVGLLGGPPDDEELAVHGRVSVLAADVGRLLARSLKEGVPPLRLALHAAEARIEEARQRRRVARPPAPGDSASMG